MKIDTGDFLIFCGAALLLGGLYLVDPRLVLVAAGLLLLIVGVARLRRMP
ncbi:MAG: hypothetical protein HC804_00190 [Anaerolineae bacterium]|nr:hypothetical protein [Anaerolineae bacterium]